jgi:divalent metal cation (Fe/Co/Zn/Cd) transporter
VVWQLKGIHSDRELRATRLIGRAFAVLAAYLVIQLLIVLATSVRPDTSGLGIIWTTLTFVVMLALAVGKIRTGTALGNPVLGSEGKVTLVDAYLAGAVLVGLVLNALFGLVVSRSAGGARDHLLRHGKRSAHSGTPRGSPA